MFDRRSPDLRSRTFVLDRKLITFLSHQPRGSTHVFVGFRGGVRVLLKLLRSDGSEA